MLKNTYKAILGANGNLTDAKTGRTFNGDIDYLFNSSFNADGELASTKSAADAFIAAAKAAAKAADDAAAALKESNAKTAYQIDYIEYGTGKILASKTIYDQAGTYIDEYESTIKAGVPAGYVISANGTSYDPTFINYKDPAVQKVTGKSAATISKAHIYVNKKAESAVGTTTYQIDYIDGATGKILSSKRVYDQAGASISKYESAIKSGVPEGYTIDTGRSSYDPSFVDYTGTATPKKLSKAYIVVNGKAAVDTSFGTGDRTTHVEDTDAIYADGYKYGETGATLPSLAGKSEAYKAAFARGFNAGAAVRGEKLAAYKAGYQYGETGAVLPDLAGKSDDYKTAFSGGFTEGGKVYADKLAGTKAGYQTGVTGATLPSLDGKSDAYKEAFSKAYTQGFAGHLAVLDAKATQDATTEANAEAAAGYKAGYQYGETGAVLPDLAGKSDAYKEAFSKGFTDGGKVYSDKQAGYKAGVQYGETGAVLPDLAGKSDAYKEAFSAGFTKGGETFADTLAGTKAGYQTGVTGATLPSLDGKSDAYKTAFSKAYTQGFAAHQAILEAQAAQNATTKANEDNASFNAYKAEEAAQLAKDVAAKNAAAAAAAKAKADQDNASFNEYKLGEASRLSAKTVADAGYKAGYQYGETGAVLPSLDGKSDAYKEAFSKGFTDGGKVYADKLAGTKAGYQTGVTGATLPDLAGKSDAYKEAFSKAYTQGYAGHLAVLDAKDTQDATTQANADKAAGYKAGYQYGETGAVLPSLDGKSDAYKNAFSEGFTAGSEVHFDKLAGYKAGYQYGETGAVLPSLDGKSDAYKDAFSAGFTKGVIAHFDAMAAAKAKAKQDQDNASFNEFKLDEASRLSAKFANKGTATTPATKPATTPATKTPATTAAVKTTAAKTNDQTTATKKDLPQTGDDVNVVASSLGVVAVVGALFGLAGTSLKKRA
ncbi:LPXTG cell wall anchor domain-containing protein [Lacticaseibacillus parakribbianus]|uniref:LPXTG cell wall anchor domain-containing protein n=1 Tax=Lacticaseibacillus parakribbianus TaxID=2970927 RepID=UPI0021CB68FC|nr:LPXTG cell wall anchor domain-containing protein [Lacticaseibacillus parakribbianus]